MVGRWSGVDDGIVQGRLLRPTEWCAICGARTSVIEVTGYTLPPTIAPLWRSLIIANPDAQGDLDVAVHLGVGCGCYAKFHRQVAHIQGSIERKPV